MKSFLVPVLFLSLACVKVKGQGKEVTPPRDSTQVAINFSELPRMVDEDERASKELLALSQDTTFIVNYKSSIGELEASVVKVVEQSDFFLKSYARPWLIQNLNAKWVRLNDSWVDLSVKISNSIETIEKRMQACHEMIPKWKKIDEIISRDSLSASLKKPIGDLIHNLDTVEHHFQNKIKTYLLFQEKVSANRATINRYLEILAPLRNQDFVSFFKRDEDFLWNRAFIHDSVRFNVQMKTSLQFTSRDSVDYLKSAVAKIAFVGGLCVFFLILFLGKARRTEVNKSVHQQTDVPYRPLHYPLTYTYTFTLLFSMLILTNRPPLLTELLLLLFTVSLIILIVKRSHGILKVITTVFIFLYWFDFLTDFLVTNPLVSSYVDLFNSLATSFLFFLLYKNRTFVQAQFPRLNTLFLSTITPVFSILNLLAVVLQLWGFTMLGRTLTTGTITFMYFAPVIVICSIALQDLFYILQETPFVKSSNLAKNYYHLTSRAVRLGAFYLLIVAFLASFSLKSLFLTTWETIWNFGGQFGEFNITVGDVLGFFLIIFVSWAISVVLKALLTDEILARTNLRRGVPMAIGIIVRYTVVFLGFILAIASTGFDLAKISILAGGLGVGIGFGLQHLVANFIAGLILIFERPMVVGDTVESEQIEGEVKQIGIRSSKILTYDGAEVIIPNSNLINNKLSNWTLSNHSRRQLIIVRTSAKADAEQVLAILDRITRQHSDVLATPEPFVLFEGQLDQSLQFKIYYWLVSNIFKTRCELNLQIYRELKELGVELPIPIQEFRTNAEIKTDSSLI